MKKKIMSFVMILALLLSYFAPITSVFAASTNKLSISFNA